MAITVHIACDDPSYRDTIESLLSEDDGIIVADKSREAESGAAAVQTVRPDVVVLAIPPAEDVGGHVQMYRAAAPNTSGFVGFCIRRDQASAYKEAGVDAVVFPSDSPSTLREAVKAACGTSSRGSV